MPNTSVNDLLVHFVGNELDSQIRIALRDVSNSLLARVGLGEGDLESISTKTNVDSCFAKFVFGNLLTEGGPQLGEGYLLSVKRAYESRAAKVPEDLFALVMGTGVAGASVGYRASYGTRIKRPLGMLLVALHSRGILTLPRSFNWPPTTRTPDGEREDPTLEFASPLMRFVRSLNPYKDDDVEPAFEAVVRGENHREWFVTYGTKLLLATGWTIPADAKLEDVLDIRRAEIKSNQARLRSVYRTLILTLRSHFGADFGVTVEDWDEHTSDDTAKLQRQSRSRFRLPALNAADAPSNESALLDELFLATPADASPAAIRDHKALPGLEQTPFFHGSHWVELEEAYVRAIRRESYKQIEGAIGYLNMYLMFYLPYWFARNRETSLVYPDVPSRLLASVFVARILPPTQNAPKTLVEFMDLLSATRDWEPYTYYALLRQMEQFFEFIELHSEELPGCAGFRQPINDFAYPAITRKRGTNKRPVPRKMFGIYIDYVEALRAHQEVVTQRILDGELNPIALEEAIARRGNVIDTYATAALVGFVPILIRPDGTVPLQFIPNCLAFKWYPLQDGRRVNLPRPHALNQILVALYTGIRHNHIQWLDARTFDSKVSGDGEFATLLVNTDKKMKSAWTPPVNWRVIEVLRDQQTWRNRINLPGFRHAISYNNNPKTKWGRFVPLFASSEGGKPHNDGHYYRCWQSLISALDGLRPILGTGGVERLCVLEPPGIELGDPDAARKRKEYGESCEDLCVLSPKTAITPHSSRVTVVSQYSTVLPAETIGSRITGQSPGTVYYYMAYDDAEIAGARAAQAEELRRRAFRSDFEATIEQRVTPRYVRADDVNSNLARSLKANLSETIVSYGCVSIVMNEDATSGLDILRETNAIHAALNDTEICPYGNHCPPEIIQQLRGFRRCGLCPYAVRSVDHLPAVAGKVRRSTEVLAELTERISVAMAEIPARYSEPQLDRLDEERARIAEELVAWRLNEEVLNEVLERIATGQETRRWVVQKPSVLEQDLRRIEAPTRLTSYLLARLGECIAFPATESAQMRARFDLLRREILARSGRVREAFDARIPVDSALEFAGLLRSLAGAQALTYDDLVNMLEGDDHLSSLGLSNTPVLTVSS